MDVSPDKLSQPRQPAESLITALRDLAQPAGSLFNKFLALFSLEAQLAKQSLVVIACTLLVLALLLSSTWIVLMAIAALWLVSAGMTWIGALSLLGGLQLLTGICLGGIIIKQLKNLRFNATNQQLQNLFRLAGAKTNEHT